MFDFEILNKELKIEFEYFDQIDSTNEEAKRRIKNNLDEDYLLIAGEQVAGKGRKGRQFYSPKDSGIYLTHVHFSDGPFEELIKVTSALAVITRRSLLVNYGINAKIKWVNDLYYNEKKVCGILCECIFANDDNKKNCIISGIGINISTEQFPDDIKFKAGSITNTSINALNSKIVVDISSGLEDFYQGKLDYFDEYVNNSIVINKSVELSDGNGLFLRGKVVKINEDCSLSVLDSDGKINNINSGEISLVMK